MSLEINIVINVVYGIVNAIVMLLTGVIVYHRDSESIVNIGFSLSTVFASIAFFAVSFSSILWTTPIFLEPGVVTLNRISYLGIILAGAFVCWSSRVLYDGQAFWNRNRNVIFFGFIIILNVFAVLTPDASYIIEGINEKHTGEGALFSLIFYPSAAILAIVTFFTFVLTYHNSKDDDHIIGKQAGRLSLASLMVIFGMVLAYFVGAQLVEGATRYISYGFTTLGILMMASGFSQEASLTKVKIMSELKRLSRGLTKGNSSIAEDQLGYLSTLVEKEKSEVSIARMKVLEGLLSIYKTNLKNARISLESAKLLAETQGLDDHVASIDRYLEHLGEHEADSRVNDSAKMIESELHKQEDLLRALRYLDEIIEFRMKQEESSSSVEIPVQNQV